jgi:hypothetical protein
LEFRCERDLAEQLMTELLRMTADLMSAREAAARLEPVSLPKIISARIDDVGRTELARQ